MHVVLLCSKLISIISASFFSNALTDAVDASLKHNALFLQNPLCFVIHLFVHYLCHFTGRQQSLLCKPCTSHRRDVCPSVCPSIRYTLVLSENDAN